MENNVWSGNERVMLGQPGCGVLADISSYSTLIDRCTSGQVSWEEHRQEDRIRPSWDFSRRARNTAAPLPGLYDFYSTTDLRPGIITRQGKLAGRNIDRKMAYGLASHRRRDSMIATPCSPCSLGGQVTIILVLNELICSNHTTANGQC